MTVRDVYNKQTVEMYQPDGSALDDDGIVKYINVLNIRLAERQQNRVSIIILVYSHYVIV